MRPSHRSKLRKVAFRRPAGRPTVKKKITFKIPEKFSKKVVTKKPPGRPWHSDSSSKVCLLCLRRFDESKVLELQEEEEQENEVNDYSSDNDNDCMIVYDAPRDPLADSPIKDDNKKEKKKVQRPNLYLRFLSIMSRYLNVKTKKFRNSAVRNKLSPPFCEECFRTVQKMCKAYEELERNRLILFWRLTQISQIIRLSKTKVSGKLGVTLLKNLSTQLRTISYSVVDLFRKHLTVKCSAKTADTPPKVVLKRTSYTPPAPSLTKTKLLYPIEHMRQYLKSLIVVFALAVPRKEPPKPDLHRKKTTSKGEKRKVEFKKENVPPSESNLGDNIKIKRELHENAGGENDDHFDGGDYSPPGSGPPSPVNNDDEEDGEKNVEDDEEEKGGDSDWSMNAGGSVNDSDVEFSVNPSSIATRRWNLRRRKTRSSKTEENDENEDDEEYTLPPLRAPRGSKSRPFIPDSEKPFSCNLCAQRFNLERSLRRHLSYAHPFLFSYNCSKCNLRFKRRIDLDLHNRKVHKPETSSNPADHKYAITTPCTVCKKVFPSKVKMMLHRKVHKLLRKLDCEICGKTIVGLFRYEKHVKSHTVKPFKCTKCCKKFEKEEQLEEHLKLHETAGPLPKGPGRPRILKPKEDTKPHKCSKCHMSFSIEEKLEEHIKLHDNPDYVPPKKKGRPPVPAKKEGEAKEGAYKCDFPNCGKSFIQKSNFTVHYSLHQSSFTCSVCEKKFDEAKDIRKHLMQKHEKLEEQLFFCLHCDKGFTVEQSYELHRKIAHPTKMKIGCDSCTEEFETKEALKEHLIQTHLTSGEIEEFVVELNLTIPKRVQEQEDKRKTKAGVATSTPTAEEVVTNENEAGEEQQDPSPPPDQTDEQAPDPVTVQEDGQAPTQNLALPSSTSLEESSGNCLYYCGRCMWPFTKKSYLDVHMIGHTPPDDQKLFNCAPCMQTFRIVDNLQYHFNRYHGPNLIPHECKFCGMKFYRKQRFLTHVRNHKLNGDEERSAGVEKPADEEKPAGEAADKIKNVKLPLLSDARYICQCGKRYRNARAFKRHKLCNGHEGREIEVEGAKPKRLRLILKEKTCECGEKFDSREHYFTHMFEVHGMEKPYKCEVEGCGKSFIASSRLRMHKISHQEKTLPCPLCPKFFRRKIHLDEHLKIHYQIRDHICDFCGKTFVKKTSLRLHLDIHMEIKRFQCSYCDKKFCRKNARDGHERTHTKEKPFVCNYCGRSFAQQCGLKGHLKAHERLNNDEVVRRPWRKSIGVGNPIQPPPQNNEQMDNQEENKDNVAPPTTSASGIIHEALQAAFSDINLELLGEKTEAETQLTSGPSVVASSDAVAAAEAVLNEEVASETSKRGRTRKNYKEMASGGVTRKSNQDGGGQTKKELVCGFCGKEFKRADHYEKHVEKHMSLDSILNVEEKFEEAPEEDILSALRRTSAEEQEQQQRSLQNTTLKFNMDNSQEQLNSREVMFSQPVIPSPTPTSAKSSPAYSNPTPPPEPPRKKRGRPRKNSAPGSRLAQIVENVMEAATVKSTAPSTPSGLTITPVSTPVSTTISSLSQQQQLQYQQQQHHQNIQNFHQSSPSPHMMHSGSERSTPTGSPAPIHHQQQQQITVTTSSSTPLNIPAPPYVNPFLFSNPYLLPRQDLQGHGQSPQQIQPTTQYIQQFHQQQNQSVYSSPEHSSNSQSPRQEQVQLTPAYNQQQGLYHHQQLLQQQRLQQQHAPQDLSKSGFSMFFANPRS